MPPVAKETFLDTAVPLFGEGITRWQLLAIGLAEMIGTFLLVFLGCMSVLVGLSLLEICLVFGLVVTSILTMFGHISCAHINPSVSVAAVILGKINVPLSALYILCQCLGSTLGYKMLLLTIPPDAKVTHCCNVPVEGVSAIHALFTEFFITSALIFVVCGVWDARNAKNTDSVPIKFGLCIAGLALISGKLSTGSMNPARSLGPAICEGIWDNHWVFWVGPLSAAILTALFYRYVLDRKVKSQSYGSHENIPLN